MEQVLPLGNLVHFQDEYVPKCSVEGEKEIGLSNMVNMVAHELLDFPAVRPLQGAETPNIEWLE